MIQRIQTIWLLLATVVVFALFLFPYLQFAGADGLGQALKVSGMFANVDGMPTRIADSWLLAGATILLGLFPLYIIFQFKDRKKQVNLIRLAMLLIVLLGVWFYFNATKAMETEGQTFGLANIGVGFFLLPIVLVLLWMAGTAIRKDDKLVRSADRLR